jgi:hypothetical protein
VNKPFRIVVISFVIKLVLLFDMAQSSIRFTLALTPNEKGGEAFASRIIVIES